MVYRYSNWVPPKDETPPSGRGFQWPRRQGEAEAGAESPVIVPTLPEGWHYMPAPPAWQQYVTFACFALAITGYAIGLGWLVFWLSP